MEYNLMDYLLGLFLFLKEKKIDKGIRFSLENFSDYQNIKTIPLYDVSIINEFGN